MAVIINYSGLVNPTPKKGAIMASMTSLSVQIGPNITYTWSAMTPGGATEAAHWRGTSLVPTDVTSRTAMPELSFKYHRNTANTADRTVISGYVPMVCTEGTCFPKEVGKVPFNFTVLLPDGLSDVQRNSIINVIMGTLNLANIKEAIVNGEGFY
jgi:hypothetical protein